MNILNDPVSSLAAEHRRRARIFRFAWFTLLIASLTICVAAFLNHERTGLERAAVCTLCFLSCVVAAHVRDSSVRDYQTAENLERRDA